MPVIQKINFVNSVLFVVVKNFNVLLPQKVEVNFMRIIPNGNDKCTFSVQFLSFLLYAKPAKVLFTHRMLFCSDVVVGFWVKG